MSKTILVILIVVLVGAGVYIYLKNTYKTPRPSEPAETPSALLPATQTPEPPATTLETPPIQANVVIYSDSGFSPASLAIKASEMVIFTNQSSEQMWVASAPHPAHTNYPEFDAKTAYPAGASYSFTFTKIGAWKYHNHLNPSKTGTITVE